MGCRSADGSRLHSARGGGGGRQSQQIVIVIIFIIITIAIIIIIIMLVIIVIIIIGIVIISPHPEIHPSHPIRLSTYSTTVLHLSLMFYYQNDDHENIL